MTMEAKTLNDCIHQAIEDASKRGWEAVVLVIVMVGLIALTGFIVRWLIRSMDLRMREAVAREERMAKRLDMLEQFVHGALLDLVHQSAQQAQQLVSVVDGLKEALSRRPCLFSEMEVSERIDQVMRDNGAETKP